MTTRFYKLPLLLIFIASVGLLVIAGARPWSEPGDGHGSQHESAVRSAESSVADAARRVDDVFHEVWKESKVEPLGPAEPLLVARRLSLALCGTVPSLEEIRALEKLPPDQQVDAHLDRLLEDRRFADYFAERLARAFVGTQDGPFLIYRRRRFVYWLSDELAKNRPYDDLVREVISAEGLWTDRPATNFITAYATEQGLQKVPLAARTARAFLGLRIDCAECHDHPFADWKQQDFHGLAAFFGQVHQSITGIQDKGGEYELEDRETKEKRPVEPRVPFATHVAESAADGQRREQLARWVTSHENPYFARAIANRVWTLLFGSGLVEPVDDLEADPRVPGVLEVLGDDFRSNGHDLRRLIRVVAATQAFRMASTGEREVSEEQEKRFAAFPLVRLRSEQIAGSLIQVSSLQTVDADSHVLVRLARLINTGQFINRYGDAGEEELNAHVGTIPQRLAMMNGEVPRDRTKATPFTAAGRINRLAPSNPSRVRIAYLVCLTRPPSSEEESYFVERLAGLKAEDRSDAVEDMLWTLVNSTEFSWNH
jgi:hypothetical protein